MVPVAKPPIKMLSAPRPPTSDEALAELAMVIVSDPLPPVTDAALALPALSESSPSCKSVKPEMLPPTITVSLPLPPYNEPTSRWLSKLIRSAPAPE